jgi:hypothetical protein
MHNTEQILALATVIFVIGVSFVSIGGFLSLVSVFWIILRSDKVRGLRHAFFAFGLAILVAFSSVFFFLAPGVERVFNSRRTGNSQFAASGRLATFEIDLRDLEWKGESNPEARIESFAGKLNQKLRDWSQMMKRANATFPNLVIDPIVVGPNATSLTIRVACANPVIDRFENAITQMRTTIEKELESELNRDVREKTWTVGFSIERY